MVDIQSKSSGPPRPGTFAARSSALYLTAEGSGILVTFTYNPSSFEGESGNYSRMETRRCSKPVAKETKIWI